jgi:hypothetical protein
MSGSFIEYLYTNVEVVKYNNAQKVNQIEPISSYMNYILGGGNKHKCFFL